MERLFRGDDDGLGDVQLRVGMFPGELKRRGEGREGPMKRRGMKREFKEGTLVSATHLRSSEGWLSSCLRVVKGERTQIIVGRCLFPVRWYAPFDREETGLSSYALRICRVYLSLTASRTVASSCVVHEDINR